MKKLFAFTVLAPWVIFVHIWSIHFLQAQSIFDALSFQEGLKADLKMNMDSMLMNKNTANELPATLTYKDAAGKKKIWNLKLEVRGKFRRRVCPFPPLKLNFSKKELKNNNLTDFDELKLVTHCINDPQGDEHILREYLVYKLYQILTPASYRVQLLRVRYQNTSNNEAFTYYAILLEDEKEMAKRVNGKLCEDCFGLSRAQFQQENIHIHDLFQFMIGNMDWNTAMLRNMKALRAIDDNYYLLVPYDFDFSGLVNASYATPDPTFGMKSKRDRKFIGFAQSQEELAETIQHFQSKKEAILDYVKNFKLLSNASRQDISQYLTFFYAQLEQGINIQETLVYSPGK